jgi:HAD superfamily hydrolase (TIGR01459 family)
VTKPELLGSVAELFDAFDTFLVDQFGVLHGGSAAYPGALDAMRRLKDAGKRVFILSNSGRRAVPNCERIAAMGFNTMHYDELISSGEVAWQLLAAGKLGVPHNARVLLLARRGDLSAIQGLEFRPVQSAVEADFVLIGGSDGDRLTLQDYSSLLAPPAQAGIPCICTNPDKVMLTPVGPRFGAGRIAELYEELGGQVTWIGKPYPHIYEFAMSRLGDSLPDRVVAIGDSIEHDIAGGTAAGLRTVLVLSGILAGADAAALTALYEAHQARPDYLLQRFA